MTRWPNFQLMQVPPPVTKFATNASTVKLLAKLLLTGGQVSNLCKWRHVVAKIGTNTTPGGQIFIQ